MGHVNEYTRKWNYSFIHAKMSSFSRDMRWPDKMRKCYYCCECCVFTELYYDQNKEGVFWREVRCQNTSLNQRTHSVTAESTLWGITTKTVYLTLTQILECEKFLSSYWIVFVYLSVKSLSRFPQHVKLQIVMYYVTLEILSKICVCLCGEGQSDLYDRAEPICSFFHT